jgi:hypothetical protein
MAFEPELLKIRLDLQQLPVNVLNRRLAVPAIE